MENSKKMNDFSAGEPQVLRKAEIARILNTVKQAPFNADNSKNSENKSFKKRSLLDIALNSAKDDNSEVAIDKDIDQTQENLQNENTTPENNETPEIINEADSQNNFDEENKKQLIEENNALIEERIKKAEQDAFLKGKEEGLEEGKLLGISEARAQSQEGLDAAISVFRIAAETIDSSDQSNLDVLNDTIQRSVLSIAQESAGFIIDTLPEKFISRINELSKLINENIKKISLDMNSEDYAIIKEFIEKDEFLSSLNIKQNKDLLRGNMRLNADGIKVDDFVSYNTSDLFLNDQPKTNDITSNTAENQKPVENEIAKKIAFKKMLLRINSQLILKLSKMKMRQKTLLKIRNQLKVILLKLIAFKKMLLRINSQLILKLSKMKMRQKTLLKVHNQLKVILLKLITFKKMLLRIKSQLILKLSKMKMRQKTLLKIRNQLKVILLKTVILQMKT
ncbi:MAG: hypothetical protein CM15mP110_3340 [Alphaproteobacteria bacterium]|nr:MAG: hypothetical protein CM15mP110_3340 [Alphaproteobacteria bacterium]